MTGILSESRYTLEVLDLDHYKTLRATCSDTEGVRVIFLQLLLRKATPTVPELNLRTEAILKKISSDGDYTVSFLRGNLQCCEGYNKNEIQCERLRGIGPKLAALAGIEPPKEIQYTRQEQTIYYPANKIAALKIIKALYNGTGDPQDMIEAQLISEDQNIGTVLVTYYLSCIRYFIDIDMSLHLKETSYVATAGPGILFLSDREMRYEQNQDDKEVDATITIFHALFGAYAFCRGTKGKSELSEWCKVRYNSPMSAMALATRETIQLKLEKSGTLINQVAMHSSLLRKFVYIVMTKNTLDDTISCSLISHLKFLTAFTGMTTYTFITRVINQGGPILALKPIPDQLLEYIKEKEKVTEKLLADGYSISDLQYIHLIYPNFQCFIASNYADMVTAAKAIEISMTADSKKNLDRYVSKATKNSTLNIKQLKQFLVQTHNSSAIQPLSEDLISSIKEKIGIDLTQHQLEAQKIMKKITKQKRAIIQNEDSDEE